MYMVTPATEAGMMAVGHVSLIFDAGKNGLRLTDDSVTRLKNEFATNDPNVVFSNMPFQDDDTERFVEICSLEMLLLKKRERERQGDHHCRHSTHPEMA